MNKIVHLSFLYALCENKLVMYCKLSLKLFNDNNAEKRQDKVISVVLQMQVENNWYRHKI